MVSSISQHSKWTPLDGLLIRCQLGSLLSNGAMVTHGDGMVAVKPRALLNHYTRDSQATSHTVVGRPTPEAQ